MGTGFHTQVRLRRAHPLATAVRDLFQAERARVERVLEDLKGVAPEHHQKADAIWLEGPVADAIPSISTILLYFLLVSPLAGYDVA